MRAVAIPITKEKSGRVKILNPTLCKRVVESLKTGPVYDMVIYPKSKERTDSDGLRKYFFAVVMEMISEETGHSAEILHDHFKRKILGVTVDKHGIEKVPSVFSKESTMPISEKQAYIDEIRRWSFDFLNISIPSPETVIL